MMSAVDLIAAAYIAFGIWRGRMRGLADEGYRLIRMLLAFVAGCGLYGFISALLKKLFSMTGGISAPLAFIIALGGAWWLTRTLKKTLATLLAARFAKYSKVGGMIAGGVRLFLVVLSIAGLFHLASDALGRDATSQSFFGKIAVRVIPGK